ncbi:hypothetical protein ACQKWADRAFT_301453 [Trichoderma austrokoningii]
MHLTSFAAALMLSLSVSAAPEIKNQTIHGSNTNGSIYANGSPSSCHNILRTAGACGISAFRPDIDPNASFITILYDIFDQYGESQNNKLCGETIVMKHNGVTKKAIVADRNKSDSHSIDMCLDLWQAFGGHDNQDSIIKGFSWSIQIT